MRLIYCLHILFHILKEIQIIFNNYAITPFRIHNPSTTLKIFPSNPSKHDSNAEESVDPGSDKKVDPELDPKAEENLEEADTKSVEVGGVEELRKKVNGKEALSPDTVLVDVRPSF